MKRDAGFWSINMVRGILAALLGLIFVPIPDMTRTLLLLPIGYALAVLGLALYGLIDSSLLLLSSAYGRSRLSRVLVALNGLVGIYVGASLFFVYYEKLHLEWFLSLAALQAFSAALGELLVARHAPTSQLTSWNYIGAGVALAFTVLYGVVRTEYASSLSPRELCMWVDGYLLAFGAALVVTSSRMLYADYALARAGNDLGQQEA